MVIETSTMKYTTKVKTRPDYNIEKKKAVDSKLGNATSRKKYDYESNGVDANIFTTV